MLKDSGEWINTCIRYTPSTEWSSAQDVDSVNIYVLSTGHSGKNLTALNTYMYHSSTVFWLAVRYVVSSYNRTRMH